MKSAGNIPCGQPVDPQSWIFQVRLDAKQQKVISFNLALQIPWDELQVGDVLCRADMVLCLWEDVLNFLNGRHVEPKHKQRPSWKVTWHVKRRGVKTTGFYYGVPEMSLKDSI